MQWQNTVEGYCDWIGEDICRKISEYLDENTLWVKRKIHQHRRTYARLDSSKYDHYGNNSSKNGNPYWHHVSLFYDQLQGLEDGYDAKVKAERKVYGGNILVLELYELMHSIILLFAYCL